MLPANIESKIRRTESCWLWTACVVRRYGQVQFNGRRERAHRAVWMAVNGPIPDGLRVCHHCDNPLCVRPDHLFLGTDRDNKMDSIRKGRHARGARVPQTKLTPTLVREIRMRRSAGESYKSLCASFGIAGGTLSDLMRRKTWSHVPEGL